MDSKELGFLFRVSVCCALDSTKTINMGRPDEVSQEVISLVLKHLDLIETEDIVWMYSMIQSYFDSAENCVLSDTISLEDFLKTFKQIRKMGPLESLIKLIPGVPKELKKVRIDPKDMAHIEAIILSMTPYERRHPECIKNTRKLRISKGCARSVEEINRLLKQFEQMKTMMKRMKNGNFKMPF